MQINQFPAFEQILTKASRMNPVCPMCNKQAAYYLCTGCNWLHCAHCHNRIVLVPEKIARKAHRLIAKNGPIWRSS